MSAESSRRANVLGIARLVLNKLFKRPTASAEISSWPDVPRNNWAIREIESASGTVKALSDGSVFVEPASH